MLRLSVCQRCSCKFMILGAFVKEVVQCVRRTLKRSVAACTRNSNYTETGTGQIDDSWKCTIGNRRKGTYDDLRVPLWLLVNFMPPWMQQNLNLVVLQCCGHLECNFPLAFFCRLDSPCVPFPKLNGVCSGVSRDPPFECSKRLRPFTNSEHRCIVVLFWQQRGWSTRD